MHAGPQPWRVVSQLDEQGAEVVRFLASGTPSSYLLHGLVDLNPLAL